MQRVNLAPPFTIHPLLRPQYGELPEHIRINDTDVIFEGEDKENQEYFDFDDIAGGASRDASSLEEVSDTASGSG